MPANYPLGEADNDLIVFNTATQIWERGTGGGGAANVAIFPNFDSVLDPNDPHLVYMAVQGDNAASFIILGRNLGDIATVSFEDVKVGANTGAAPTVNSLTVAATSIIVRINAVGTTTNDYWGVLCTDGDGNVYAAPSPLRIVGGA